MISKELCLIVLHVYHNILKTPHSLEMFPLNASPRTIHNAMRNPRSIDSDRQYIFSSFFVTEKLPYVVTRDVCPSVRPSVRVSSVEISLERGSKRSAKPIYLKIGLNMDN